MARFYDTASAAELARVEGLLRRGGIEYSLVNRRSDPAIREILVAEEDIGRAEELIARG